jgi:hypothetical protein
LTALVAILAFLAFYPIVAQVAGRRSIAQPIVADPLATNTTETNAAIADAADENAADANAAEPAAAEAPRAEERQVIERGATPMPRNQQYSTWDFIWLSIAGLIAYELGRGTAAGPATAPGGNPDDGPPPAADSASPTE